jgi:transposase
MTRERVLRLLALGKSQREIARELGITKSTVAYHARRVLEPDRKFRKRYDWAAVQAYYDAGHSITECQERFGFARKTWQDARRRGAVASRPQGAPSCTSSSPVAPATQGSRWSAASAAG